MIKMGAYNELRAAEEFDFGMFLRKDYSEKVLLPRKFCGDLKIGEKITVFIYTDSEDRIVATTQKPNAVIGEFAVMQVKESNDIGAFLDWGLDKDLLCPIRCQKIRMNAGESYVVRVCYDNVSDRIFATSKIGSFFEEDLRDLEVGQQIELLVYGEGRLGMKVVIDQKYEGIVYDNELARDLKIGETLTGYVKKLRNDGKVDVSLQPVGYKALMETKNIVVEKLQEAGGSLPYNGKTDAETIKEVFNLSKKAFKKLIGGLYKDKVITITDDGMKLN